MSGNDFLLNRFTLYGIFDSCKATHYIKDWLQNGDDSHERSHQTIDLNATLLHTARRIIMEMACLGSLPVTLEIKGT